MQVRDAKLCQMKESHSEDEGGKYTELMPLLSTVIKHSLSCSRFFLKTQEKNQMFNSERTARLRNHSPDTHLVRFFLAGIQSNWHKWY